MLSIKEIIILTPFIIIDPSTFFLTLIDLLSPDTSIDGSFIINQVMNIIILTLLLLYQKMYLVYWNQRFRYNT